MTPQPLVPAGFWRRYAAWSLDAVPALLLACLFTRRQLQAMGDALAATAHALADRLATTMLHAFEQGSGVLLAALALAFDPGLRDGSRALAAALTRGLPSTVLVFAVLMLLQHVAFEQSRWRGTPGKRALGLVVADMQRRGAVVVAQPAAQPRRLVVVAEPQPRPCAGGSAAATSRAA